MLARFTHSVADSGFRGGAEILIPRLFYRYDTKDDSAGHWRTLPRKAGGWFGVRHHWNVTAPGWAKTRVWNILGLVTIIHIKPGEDLKRTTPSGWHFRFAKITIERGYHMVGIAVHSSPPGWEA